MILESFRNLSWVIGGVRGQFQASEGSKHSKQCMGPIQELGINT